MSFRAILANNSPYSKALLTMGIALISGFFFVSICMVIASVFYHVDIKQVEEILKNYDDPRSLPLVKFIQIVGSIGTFIIPAFVLAWLFDSKALSYLKVSNGVSTTSVVLASILIVSALPLINFIGELNLRMSLPSWLSGVENWMREAEDSAKRLTEKLLQINSGLDLFLVIVMVALIPAIGEELIFRGLLQRIFSEWSKNIHVAIWVSAILFSAMHMQFYGFIPRMLLGAMLGYLFAWSGTLWLPIIAHFINNATIVILMHMFKQQMINVDPDKIGTESDYSGILMSAVITAAILWTIYKRERKARLFVAHESIK